MKTKVWLFNENAIAAALVRAAKAGLSGADQNVIIGFLNGPACAEFRKEYPVHPLEPGPAAPAAQQRTGTEL